MVISSSDSYFKSNNDVVEINTANKLKTKRFFIKKCKKLGIIYDIKDRQHYTKPSEKRRRAKERAIRRRIKEEKKRRK